jgi:phosphoglycolate phosphatase
VPTITPDRLILFDIDATLLKTEGAGMAAMADAGRELFGPHFTTQGIEFAGRLDPLIFRELFILNRHERTPEAEQRLRTLYRAHLAHRLETHKTARALPGVLDLVSSLRTRPSTALGVLTGNFPETGRLKLIAAALSPDWFTINAWGDDSPHDPPDRAHLPPVALARYRAAHAADVHPSRVTIIGDTPHDVRCARAHACRCIAVATGQFSMDALTAAGADLVLPDLSQTSQVLDWLDASRA